jgi:hypothetical protein
VSSDQVNGFVSATVSLSAPKGVAARGPPIRPGGKPLGLGAAFLQTCACRLLRPPADRSAFISASGFGNRRVVGTGLWDSLLYRWPARAAGTDGKSVSFFLSFDPSRLLSRRRLCSSEADAAMRAISVRPSPISRAVGCTKILQSADIDFDAARLGKRLTTVLSLDVSQREMRNRSSFLPDLSCALTQCGCLPRPDHFSAGFFGF